MLDRSVPGRSQAFNGRPELPMRLAEPRIGPPTTPQRRRRSGESVTSAPSTLALPLFGGFAGKGLEMLLSRGPPHRLLLEEGAVLPSRMRLGKHGPINTDQRPRNCGTPDEFAQLLGVAGGICSSLRHHNKLALMLLLLRRRLCRFSSAGRVHGQHVGTLVGNTLGWVARLGEREKHRTSVVREARNKRYL